MRATLWQDLRYALRLLGRAPGFAVVAIVTVAVAIGANVAMFSVAKDVVFAPLPYPDPDRLVRVFEHSVSTGQFPVSPANFIDYRTDVRAFEAIAAYERADLQLFEDDRPEHLRAMRVTAGFFALLGMPPTIGREFTRAEEAGQADLVMISHELWQRRFAGDRAAIGRTISMSGRRFQIIGVVPPSFVHIGSHYRSYGYAEPVDAWWIRDLDPAPGSTGRNSHFLNVVARLRPGRTIEQAQAEMDRTSRRLAALYPASNTPWTTTLVDAREEIVGPSTPMVVALLGAVQLVLLLACANVAGLLLGRSASRAREIGVRAALGATRARLGRQLLIESFVLAAAGGAAGLGLAALLIELLVRFGPADVPRLQTVAIDPGIFVYAVLATTLTALLFGLAPAWQLARSNVVSTLKETGRGAVTPQRLRRGLVVAQVALAFVLVVAAGLLLRSLVRLVRTDQGFRADRVLTAVVNLPRVRYDDTAGAIFYQRLIDDVAAVPGVRAVGLGSALPWTGYDENTSFEIVGRTFPRGEGPGARYHAVTPGFFEALSVPLVAGRHVERGDTAGTSRVVVVNDALARRYFTSARNAVGARIHVWGAERTIVGVVGDVKDAAWARSSAPALYFPKAQQTVGGDMLLAVLARDDPERLIVPVQRALQALDPTLPLARVRTLGDIAAATFAGRRFTLVLCAGFGSTALFLAMVGIYGIMAQSVAQRTREFGVRQALGARPADIRQIVIRSGLFVSVTGVICGAGLSVLAAQAIASMLYDTRTTDATTYGAVAVLLLTVSLVASYLPARRAMRVALMEALRD